MKPLHKPIAAVLICAGILLLIYWQTGGFAPKISAASKIKTAEALAGGHLIAVQMMCVPTVEEAVGTIQSRHRVDVSPQIQATIVEIKANSGDKVREGGLLARLDTRDLDAREGQAEQALTATEANLRQATADYNRTLELVKRNVASVQEGENAHLRLDVTSATLGEARRALEQVRVARSYAEIRSPVSGVVIEKQQNVGDLAQPGRPILSIYDPAILRLEAPVRETLARNLRIGDPVRVRVGTDAAGTTGTIDEIVPQADVASRSFLVKVLLPGGANLYAGMYGRLIIETGVEDVPVIPRDAVRRVGQLEFVDAATSGGIERRFIQTGRSFGQRLEVLSGLVPGEMIRFLLPGMEK